MRYDKPAIASVASAIAYVMSTGGNSKSANTCNDHGDNTSTGAYELDE